MSSFTRRSVMLSAAGLAGLSALPLRRARAAGEVNLYSARHYPADEQLFALFTEQTGIAVNQIKGTGAELMERIKLEGEQSPCDVFVTVDAGNLWRAQEEGIYQPISSAELEQHIPANLREPSGRWFSFAKRARVIIYDTTKVKEADLSTYEDLASEKWKGRILIRSSSNIYNQSLVASMIHHNGVEATQKWCEGIVANMARPPKGGDTDQINALVAGEGDIAVSNTYYFARLLSGDDDALKEKLTKIKVFFPNQNGRGTHVNVSGAGVAAHAPNKDNATKFLEFMISPEAQAIFAGANFEYPVRDGAEQAQVIASWGKFKEDTINVVELGKNNAEAVKIMDRAAWA
ncbi:Fe(3+) ABC transporter substrate-binding protein [Dongia deserti]|uniref:Fe(3+) ABC transporter substrate-binding protein n=1 Tax=Dongia deserti TaxID=2268030 RepID=UPI000E64A2DF|nr:Fe(3+) ABC transporter substrate-binding protein [Dongia deserti]